MKIILFILFLLPTLCFAQKVSPADSITKEIMLMFNNEDFEQIYSTCSGDFQNSINKEQFLAFCTQLKFSKGKMKKYSHLINDGNSDKYDIVFEKDTLNMWIELSKSKKISLLLFKPREGQTPSKNIISGSDNSLKTPLDLKIDSIIKPYILRSNSIGAIIGVIKNNQNFIYRYGETKIGNKTLPDTNTIFEIASITKTFTSLFLAFEVKQGNINLNDPINKYLPAEIPFQGYDGKPVLIKHLATHSSGLPGLPTNFYLQKPIYDSNNPYKYYSKADLYSFLKTYHYIKHPGKKYEYSNFGVGLLGNILEKASGETYLQLLESLVCKPLNLINTSVKLSAEKIKQMPQGYNAKQAVPTWDFKALAAAGAIRSSISDMIKYANAFINPPNENFKSAILLCEKINFDDGNRKVGLGWHIKKAGIEDVYFHNGQTAGFASFICYDRVKHCAVIMLTNSSVLVDNEGVEIMKYLVR